MIAREKRTFEYQEMVVLVEAKGGVLIQCPWVPLQGLWDPILATFLLCSFFPVSPTSVGQLC